MMSICRGIRFMSRSSQRAMSNTGVLIAFLCCAAPAVLLVFGCSENPQEPVFANPFDPDAPGSSDPLNLRAIYGDGKVTLTWTGIAGHGIETYTVTLILAGTPYELDRLEALEGTMSYVVQNPSPSVVNAYLVRALDANGFSAATSHVVPAEVVVPPILGLASGKTEVRSRYQDLVVQSIPGYTVQVDTMLSFDTAVQALVGDDGTAVLSAFDLGPRPSAAARCTLYAAAVFELGDGKEALRTDVDKLILRIVFNPTINRPDTTFTVAVPWTDLVVSDQAVGVQSMLFASSAEALAEADTLPGAPLVENWPLLDTPLPQRVHARFISEFGFSRTRTLDLSADNLNGAAFALDLPPNRVTSNPTISIRCRAVATEMRISQYPDFRDAPWQPYAKTSQITLDGAPGSYQVFAWFRNHWFESAILTEQVVLAGDSPQIAFLHPAEGQVVRGGTTIQLAGTAGSSPGAEPVSEVQVNTGQGWVPAAGTDHWSAFWTVPLLEADTAHALGARALLATDDGGAATTWINVTISRLRVAITAPLDGARIPWGEDLTISGTAAPLLGGADLDSVVVAVLDESLTVLPPLSSWSVDWAVPPGDGTVATTLTATVHAGFESASHQIEITVAPPKPLE